MARRDDSEEVVMGFGGAASRSSRPGPKPRDDSLRALTETGEMRWLKSALPKALHREVHVQARRRDTTASQIVAEALKAYLGHE